MQIYQEIELLIKSRNLGTEIKNITKVTGGLSHRMYKVETNMGTYAVKELNPVVMKREDAYSNFVFSEQVANIAKANNIPAIEAIKINNDIIEKVNNSYFMLFRWLDGKVLKPEDITTDHCKIIGSILGKLHNVDFSSINKESKSEEILKELEWEKFLEQAKKDNKRYYELLRKNINILKQINKKSMESMEYANKNLIISHRDLDRKNVMWKDGKAYIIDWEASGYVNPIIEVISTAYYWAGGETENLDIFKIEAFLNSYKKYSKIEIDKNSEILVYADFYSGLNWIEYNLKRSMCIENNYDEEEIELATNEVIKSINDIKYNISQIDKIIEAMKKSSKN